MTDFAALRRWMDHGDRGNSSDTIAMVLEPEVYVAGHLRTHASVPWDAGDFGRCLDLVEVAGLRDRLPEVAARIPDWAWLVEAWDALAAMHRNGERDRLNRCLREGRLL